MMDVCGQQVMVKVWDTAGQERFNAISTRYYKGADGILLVYDITVPGTIFTSFYFAS